MPPGPRQSRGSCLSRWCWLWHQLCECPDSKRFQVPVCGPWFSAPIGWCWLQLSADLVITSYTVTSTDQSFVACWVGSKVDTRYFSTVRWSAIGSNQSPFFRCAACEGQGPWSNQHYYSAVSDLARNGLEVAARQVYSISTADNHLITFDNHQDWFLDVFGHFSSDSLLTSFTHHSCLASTTPYGSGDTCTVPLRSHPRGCWTWPSWCERNPQCSSWPFKNFWELAGDTFLFVKSGYMLLDLLRRGVGSMGIIPTKEQDLEEAWIPRKRTINWLVALLTLSLTYICSIQFMPKIAKMRLLIVSLDLSILRESFSTKLCWTLSHHFGKPNSKISKDFWAQDQWSKFNHITYYCMSELGLQLLSYLTLLLIHVYCETQGFADWHWLFLAWRPNCWYWCSEDAKATGVMLKLTTILIHVDRSCFGQLTSLEARKQQKQPLRWPAVW